VSTVNTKFAETDAKIGSLTYSNNNFLVDLEPVTTSLNRFDDRIYNRATLNRNIDVNGLVVQPLDRSIVAINNGSASATTAIVTTLTAAHNGKVITLDDTTPGNIYHIIAVPKGAATDDDVADGMLPVGFTCTIVSKIATANTIAFYKHSVNTPTNLVAHGGIAQYNNIYNTGQGYPAASVYQSGNVWSKITVDVLTTTTVLLSGNLRA